MLKALLNGVVILGLSEENIKRLREGKPMSFNLDEISLPDRQIVIFTGKDEESMAKQLTGYGAGNK